MTLPCSRTPLLTDTDQGGFMSSCRWRRTAYCLGTGFEDALYFVVVSGESRDGTALAGKGIQSTQLTAATCGESLGLGALCIHVDAVN